MAALSNRLLVSLGLIGSLMMIVVMGTQISQSANELLPQFARWLALAAATISLLATSFALTSIDRTGITHEGRATAIIPIALAACGLALTVRWTPTKVPLAAGWLLLHVPGALVGIRLPASTLLETMRRAQATSDRRIATEWELKQLTNRVNLLQQIIRPEGPDPAAQKKLATTGNTVQKYHTDTRKQLQAFLSEVDDDELRTAANNLLSTIEQMEFVEDP